MTQLNTNSLSLDIVKEFINIGAGKAASILNEMFSSHIGLEIPYVTLCESSLLRSNLGLIDSTQIASISMDFMGSFHGEAHLIIPFQSANRMLSTIVPSPVPQDDVRLVRANAFSEIGNIVINSVVGSISNLFKTKVDFTVPVYKEETVGQLLFGNMSSILFSKALFEVSAAQEEVYIFLLFNKESLEKEISRIASTYFTN